MANQAIALQARVPQNDFMGRAIQQNAQVMNMMTQQRAAERQAAQAQQALEMARAEEARKAELHGPAMEKAGFEATSAQIKMVDEFLDLSIEGMKAARNPEDAIKIGQWLKTQFSDPQLQDAVDQTLSSLPQDPSQFDAWRQQTLYQSMDAKDQLERDVQRQTTGTEERLISMPKYAGAPGGMGATEVPGSRIQAAPGITYVKGPNGEVIPMPKTMPGGGGFDGGAPSAPAGGGGGSPVARALQTNPGALKDGPFARSQPGYVGASGGFATFKTPEDGIRAQENLLRTAYLGRGFNTIDKIINRYAPQGPENSAASVANYKKYVAQRAGVDINAPLTPQQVPAVAAAMREFETGKRPGGKGAGASIRMGEPVVQGQPKTPKSTEAERRFGTISRQMRTNLREAVDILTKNPSAIRPSGVEYAASQIPFYGEEAALFAQSEPRQQFVATILRFLDNVTFVNTGAGTSKAQEENYRRSYIPTYQDTPASSYRKLKSMVEFAQNVKDAAGVLWSPELDADFKALTAAVERLKPARGAGGAAAPAARSTQPRGQAGSGWGKAKVVGN